MKSSTILKKTRKLIAPRGRWAQEYSAYTKDGKPIEPFEKNAYSYCLAGAVGKVTGRDSKDTSVIDALYKTISGLPAFRKRADLTRLDVVVIWNDHNTRTKREVLSVVDKTIKRLEKEKK